MCNVSEYFIERATEIGLSRGMEQGIQQGLEQGLEQGIKALVSSLRKLNQSNDFILSEIIEKFNVTEEKAMKHL